MVFNWFRRKFGDSSPKEEPTPTNEPLEEQDKIQEDEEKAESTPDYLNWAKAAYKNIQERQKTEPEETTSSPEADNSTVTEVEPEPVETTTEAENLEPVSEVEAEPVTENVETVSEVEAESPPDIQLTTPSEPIVEEIEPIVTEVEPIVEAAPLPFWATEDRQARLEKLKETAVETEEESTPIVSPPPEEIEEIAFDEGFLWSAEVLAAQGRRPEDVSLEEISWLKRLRQGLEKTRRGLVNQLKGIVGQGPLNQAAVIEVEALLLQADVGVEATDHIISRLQKKLKEETLPPDAAIAYLKQILREMLESPFEQDYQRNFVPEKDTLNIWLLTGVNGVGKTTTIGKIAHLAQKSGYKCLIGAADTFRAAAVEQVKIWGERSGIEVIANPGKNVDPAAVVFDAISAAQSRGTELLLVDTAGRLQNKKNLMDELSKIRRIVDKKAPNAQIESLLVLDSTLGQNGLRQAQVFAEAAKLSGVVITKLDGTAKGGVALAVVQELGLPIRFIGAGEGIEDLRPFSSYEFVEALLNG
ncbi:signal recognition particle-docking protein FtsY [Merismopedia glauca]|uniref:Signal recognition particle receptor FtsY n=1 Tax=Merismopedia glauca CCAP 1448/3 TaxID=1296344 RepID=A0A2T1C4Z3_9CYAN|nr:signal recognition particle-docking protein FtsY [Merismopedia glauca]PSB03321.1 signal recognition particle-docking protein FtsY [Merismopedia glauca CCAP 1448/3]